MDHFFISIEYWRLLIALSLGVVIGIERSYAHKTAGMRTYGLVAMGACLFVMLGQMIAATAGNETVIAAIVAAVITGIGFLCGGVIIFQNHQLSGLTTAAGLWTAAGVGMAEGFGLVGLAVFVTIITLVVFTVLWFVERFVTGTEDKRKL